MLLTLHPHAYLGVKHQNWCVCVCTSVFHFIKVAHWAWTPLPPSLPTLSLWKNRCVFLPLFSNSNGWSSWVSRATVQVGLRKEYALVTELLRSAFPSRSKANTLVFTQPNDWHRSSKGYELRARWLEVDKMTTWRIARPVKSRVKTTYLVSQKQFFCLDWKHSETLFSVCPSTESE